MKRFWLIFSGIILLRLDCILGACSNFTTCESCLATSGSLCRWCLTDQSCHYLQITGECPSGDHTLVYHYNCPKEPQQNSVFEPDFAKFPIYPFAAASYSKRASDCFHLFQNATLVRQITVSCHELTGDTCSAFSAIYHTGNAIVLSFKGTELDSLQIIDEFLDTIFKDKRPFIGGGSVAAYFYGGFYALWNAGLQEDVANLRAQYPNYEVWVTGHSLGGSMASICAGVLSKLEIWPKNQIKLITFGQPRTGDMPYAAAHDSLLDYSYRVIHNSDIVAHIPPDFFTGIYDPYYHHRYEIWYPNDMTNLTDYKFCPSAEDPTCSDTVLLPSVDDHIVYYGHRIGNYGRGGCHDGI